MAVAPEPPSSSSGTGAGQYQAAAPPAKRPKLDASLAVPTPASSEASRLPATIALPVRRQLQLQPPAACRSQALPEWLTPVRRTCCLRLAGRLGRRHPGVWGGGGVGTRSGVGHAGAAACRRFAAADCAGRSATSSRSGGRGVRGAGRQRRGRMSVCHGRGGAAVIGRRPAAAPVQRTARGQGPAGQRASGAGG